MQKWHKSTILNFHDQDKIFKKFQIIQKLEVLSKNSIIAFLLKSGFKHIQAKRT